MKKSGKIGINAVDVIAVILLIALVFGIVWRFASPSTNVTSGAKTVEYTLKINGVRPFTAPYYKVGTKCFDKNTNDFIGTIKDVRIEQLYVRLTDTNGEMYKAERPNEVVLYLTIESDGRETADAVYAGVTYKLKIGSEVHLVTKYNDVTSTVEAIGDNSVIVEGPLYTGSYER